MADRRRAWLVALAAGAVTLLVFLVTRPAESPGNPSGSPSVSPIASPSASSDASPSSTAGGSPGPTGSGPAGSTPSPIARPSPIATPIPGSDASGTWTGTWTNEAPDTSTGALSLVLTQAGPDVTGTLRMEQNNCVSEQVVTGTADDGRIELQNGLRDEVELTGTIAGGRMTGTFTMSCENASGTWSVSRN